MKNWNSLSTERKNKFLRAKNNLELVEIFGKNEDFYQSQRKGNWDALKVVEQYTHLRDWDSPTLAKKYGKTEGFFDEAKKFMVMAQTKTKPKRSPHTPPKKRMVLSARRDLNFSQALCELIDNSIDGRLIHHSDKPLQIVINFDITQSKGFYYDNAGGMSQKEIFMVFIPGETIEDESLSNPTIGSFAMGAKKAIFHISDGTTVFSALKDKKTYYASIPESWENIEEWDVEEGEASFQLELFDKKRPLNGETFILFERLIDCPIATEIGDIKLELGKIYAELLKGKRKDLKLSIKINNEKIEPIDPIVWGNPKGGGAEPKRFKFSKIFNDLGGELNEGKITFELAFGLLTKSSNETGIDVYGNYRLFDENLRSKIGLSGTRKTGLAMSTPGSRLIKGKLLIIGPSEGIPWDTHKRHYIADHPVAKYLKDCFDDIYISYKKIAEDIGSGTYGTKGVNTYLKDTDYNKDVTEFELIDLGLVDRLPEWDGKNLPKWSIKKEEPAEEDEGKEEEEEAEAEGGDEEEPEDENKIVIKIDDFSDNQKEIISKRTGDQEESIKVAISKLIDDVVEETTVIITLTKEEYETLCSLLECDNSVDLASRIKEQLMEHIK